MGIQFSAIDTTRVRTSTTPSGDTIATPVRVQLPERWEFFGWCASNASAVFELLGIEFGDGYGQASIGACRRAICHALATFSATAPGLTRKAQVHYGLPTVSPDGSVDFPISAVTSGLDAAGIRQRLEAFAGFVEAASAAGANAIRWS